MHLYDFFSLATTVATLKLFGSVAMVDALLSPNGSLYPQIADTSHASWEVTNFFRGYYTTKSLHDIDIWLDFFHPTEVVFFDTTAYQSFLNRSTVEKEIPKLAATWHSDGRSYPFQILGNTAGAILHTVDTPGLFGAEVRIMSAIDFRDGKITRQVDYWDARRNPLLPGRLPESPVPLNLGLDTVDERAAPEMDKVAHQLNEALATGDATAAAALFSNDAVFEDFTLRTRQEGQLAIGRYLQRILPKIPYGVGATLLHVLGSARGGGYEWRPHNASNHSVRNGITSLELDESGAIVQLTTIWDGSLMSDSDIRALALLSLEE